MTINILKYLQRQTHKYSSIDTNISEVSLGVNYDEPYDSVRNSDMPFS